VGVPARAWASAGVVVPHVGSSLSAAYAVLHERGFAVSLPAVVIGGSRVPVVVGVVPRPGLVVARGATARLQVRWARRRSSVRGRSGVVPSLVGGRASAVAGRARRGGVHVILRLGGLIAGGAPSLLENYTVVNQSPVAGDRSRTVMVWGVQERPVRVGECRFPWHSHLVTRDSQAAVFLVGTDTTGVWYGCALARGKVLTLGGSSFDENNGGTAVNDVILAGGFVAVELETLGGKYDSDECGLTAMVTALGTSAQDQIYSGDCGGISSLVLNSSGFTAWLASTGETTFTPLNDVACPSVTLCVAVDQDGHYLTTSSPTGGYGAWTVTPGVAGPAQGIACPSVNLCVSAGGSSIGTSTDPAAGSGSWTVGQVPGPALPGSGLFDVTCATSALCAAVGDHSIATTTDPAGGASTWTAATLSGTHDMFGVACPSVSLCVVADGASGGYLLTSTNPTGGSSAWTTTPIPGAENFLGGVSCPSVSLCVADNAGGQIATSTNPTGGPTAWKLANINGGFLTRTACPTTSLCVTGSLDGLAWSTNPTGGPTAWNHATLNDGNGYIGIACPSTTLCVAVSSNGHAASSIDPTGGPSTWTDALIDGPSCAVNTPCITEQLYAHDDQGTSVLDTAGPGSSNSIANITLTGDQLTWTHDGTPHSATLH
jgi:hypothetical protein